MSTIDQQFVEYIAKSLVGSPDDVSVERTIDERGVLLKLTVNPEDLGRIIGKRGSTAIGIRTLLRALGTKNDARYNLKIVDPTGGYSPRRDDDVAVDDSQPQTEPSESSVASKSAEVAEPETESNTADDKTVNDVEEEEPQEKSRDSLADKTRKELAELDDLDI